MCGIVGLFLKNPTLELDLGRMLAPMLATMSDRGPDSAGFAVYGPEQRNSLRLTVRSDAPIDADALTAALKQAGVSAPQVRARDTHATIFVSALSFNSAQAAIAKLAPAVQIVSSGKRMDIYKEVGLPEKVAERFGLEAMTGSHAIGHTRMATESAVTTKGAHPVHHRHGSMPCAQWLAL